MEPQQKNTKYFIIIFLLILTILALIFFGIIPSQRKQKLTEMAWCYDFNSNLGLQDIGKDIKALQTILKKEGLFEGAADGIFGNSTASAVVAFQQKHTSILASLGTKLGTGYADEITRNKLNELYGCKEEFPEIEWVTYKNENYQYEIGYPNVLNEGGEYIPQGALHKMWRRNSDSQSWETLNVEVKKSSYASFDQLWTNINTQAQEKFSTTNREKCIDSFEKLPDFDGSKVFYNYKAGCVAPPDTINSEAIILRGDKSYHIFHSCAAGLNCRERFNQILATFKFFGEEEKPKPAEVIKKPELPKLTEAPRPPQPPTIPQQPQQPQQPAPVETGSLNLSTSSGVPATQTYRKGEIAAKLTEINFTAGAKEDIIVSQVALEIKRSNEDNSEFLRRGDINDLRLVQSDGSPFGLIIDTAQGTANFEPTVNFSGELVVKAGTTETLTLVGDISATTTATYFESSIPLAYTSIWVKSTGSASQKDIVETGGARRKVIIEERVVPFVGGGGGGGGGRSIPEEPEEQHITISLASENPASRDIIPPDPKATQIASELFLVYEINNPFDRDVSFNELAVLLEGTAKPSDFGKIVWQSDGNLVSWSNFDEKGYAKAPYPSTQGYKLPLLTIGPKSKKTVQVFVFLKPAATPGATANLAMPTQKDYLFTNESISGFPIRGNVMTIKERLTEEGVTITLSAENPASQDIIAPEPLASVIASNLFLAFDVNNYTDKPVSIEELAVGLEGTAEPIELGKIIWQSDGEILGASYFGTQGSTYKYAHIPDQYVYPSKNPLLTILAKSKKTVRVFVYVNSSASQGATAKLVMYFQQYYVKSVSEIRGFPIKGNLMTIKKAAEEKKTIKASLCPDNPASHEVASGASLQPADVTESGQPRSEASHLFLCFEVENPNQQPVSIEKMGLLLEGTAEPNELGKVIWEADGNLTGVTYFGTAGGGYRYAQIPDPLNYYSGSDTLLTIPAKAKKTVKVFAYVRSTATMGHTIKFSMPSAEYFLYAPNLEVDGLPLKSNAMTITNEILKAKLLKTGGYEIDSKPGQTLTAIIPIENIFAEDMIFTQLLLSDNASNKFLSWLEEDSMNVQYLDKNGTTKTSVIRDAGRNAPDGSRIFDIVPSVVLPAGGAVSYAITAKIKDSAPESLLVINVNDISGYGSITESPVVRYGSLTLKIDIKK